MKSWLRNVPKVTFSLIAINSYAFVAFAYYNDLLFPLDYLPVNNDFIYFLISLFSFIFHADVYHLFANMLFLWVFGSYLEEKIGSKQLLIYYFISSVGATLLHSIANGEPAIGASGAISGMMGIYLYRCHYSKNKTTIPLFFYFSKVNLNAKWLLLFWILRDIYDFSYAIDNIACVANIGGFLTGIIIGKVNHYWIEGRGEHLYHRITNSINKKWGLTEAEDDLLKILNIDPNNPEVNLQLARYFSGNIEKKKKGKKYYLAAARAYYLNRKDRSMAGEVFLEYIERFSEHASPQIHLKYAKALSDVHKYYSALKILEPLIDKNILRGSVAERIFLSYIDYSLKADLKGTAHYAYEKFKNDFPDSLLIKKAESLIQSYKSEIEKNDYIEKAARSDQWPGITEDMHDSAVEPLF